MKRRRRPAGRVRDGGVWEGAGGVLGGRERPPQGQDTHTAWEQQLGLGRVGRFSICPEAGCPSKCWSF